MKQENSSEASPFERKVRIGLFFLYLFGWFNIVFTIGVGLYVHQRIISINSDGDALLVSREDGTIHSMVEIEGEPRTVTLDVLTYPVEGGPEGFGSKASLHSSQEGRASIEVSSMKEILVSSIVMKADKSGPSLVFNNGPEHPSYVLAADTDGLYIRTLDTTGAATGEYRLSPQSPEPSVIPP